jgi:hypothetical protein
VNGDNTPEDEENFTLKLKSVSGAILGSSNEAIGTIVNDDQAVVSLTPAQISLEEGNSNTTAYEFKVELDQPSNQDVTVYYETNDGTATVAEGDYVDNDDSIIIKAGYTEGSIKVLVNGDNTPEDEENFTLKLKSVSGAILSSSNQATGIIVNDDFQNEPTLEIMGEFGRVNDILTHEPLTIQLNNSYINPVVFATIPSYNGSDPGVVRITNIANNEFSMFFQESSATDPYHITESVSYMVLEAGTWELANGSLLEVGKVDTNLMTTQGWEEINFSNDFTNSPVMFSQVQTNNEPGYVVTRQSDIASSGFKVSMQEEEATMNTTHAEETIGWMALSSGSGTWGDYTYQAGLTGDQVAHNWFNLGFGVRFNDTPQLFASMNTFDGPDTATLRYQNLSKNNVKIMVEEEKTLDSEVLHNTENVGFLALEGSGNLSAFDVAPPVI